MPNAVDIKDSSVINITPGLYLQTGTLVVFLTARPTARISCGHNSISAGITSENGTSFPTLSWGGLYPHMYVLSRVVVKRAKSRVLSVSLSVEKELRSFGLRRPSRTTGRSYTAFLHFGIYIRTNLTVSGVTSTVSQALWLSRPTQLIIGSRT